MSSLSAAVKVDPNANANANGRLEGAETSRMTAPEERRPETAANVTLSRPVINKSAGGGGVLDFHRFEKDPPLEKTSRIDSSPGGAGFIIHAARYTCPPNASTAVAISTAARIQMH